MLLPAPVCHRQGLEHSPSDCHRLPPTGPAVLERTRSRVQRPHGSIPTPPWMSQARLKRQALLPNADTYLENSARSFLNPPETAQFPSDRIEKETPGMKSQCSKFAHCLSIKNKNKKVKTSG